MSIAGHSSLVSLWRFFAAALRLAKQGRLPYAVRFVLRRLLRNGFAATQRDLAFRLAQGAAFKPWIVRYDTLDQRDLDRLRAKLFALVNPPLVSLLMPTYNSPEAWLEAAIHSVRQQLYPHWELCITDDASTAKHVRPLLERLSQEDSRIRVHFRNANGHISAASNDALSMAIGEFVALIDHDDVLPSHALALVALTLAEHPNCDLLYSDEDKIDLTGERSGHYFKPDWNPDLLRCQNMVSHFGVFRRELVRSLGGFRTGYEGSQDWDLALRVCEATDAIRIRHLPFIIYHWRIVPGSTSTGVNAKSYAVDAGRRAVQEHLQRLGIDAEVVHHHNGQFRVRYALPSPPPTVSLLVALDTPADAQALRAHSKNWLLTAGIPVFEIVTNGDLADERVSTADGQTVVIDAGPASTPTNRRQQIANRASGDVLVFLSPLLEARESGWLKELVSHAMRPETGAVGTRLIGSNGELVGGGYILGLKGLAGAYLGGIGAGDSGYAGRGQLQQNLSAVSGDCLAVRRDRYHAVGGFNAVDFPTRWADVDLCIRLRRNGMWNVWTPYASLHYASSPWTLAEAYPDDENLRKHWAEWLTHDPAYNPNLGLDWSQPIVSAPRHTLPWREEIES
ncbi:MAG: glycosyltransferase [Propionivibrio sp.]|nr:glycosyltransferase [Propionivibrio sp.]